MFGKLPANFKAAHSQNPVLLSEFLCASCIIITECNCQDTTSQILLFKLWVNTMFAITRTSKFIVLELVVGESHKTWLSAHEKGAKLLKSIMRIQSYDYGVWQSQMHWESLTTRQQHVYFSHLKKNILLSNDRVSTPVESHSNLASTFRTGKVL